MRKLKSCKTKYEKTTAKRASDSETLKTRYGEIKSKPNELEALSADRLKTMREHLHLTYNTKTAKLMIEMDRLKSEAPELHQKAQKWDNAVLRFQRKRISKAHGKRRQQTCDGMDLDGSSSSICTSCFVWSFQ
jgi:hypothetical protein